MSGLNNSGAEMAEKGQGQSLSWNLSWGFVSCASDVSQMGCRHTDAEMDTIEHVLRFDGDEAMGVRTEELRGRPV